MKEFKDIAQWSKFAPWCKWNRWTRCWCWGAWRITCVPTLLQSRGSWLWLRMWYDGDGVIFWMGGWPLGEGMVWNGRSALGKWCKWLFWLGIVLNWLCQEKMEFPYHIVYFLFMPANRDKGDNGSVACTYVRDGGFLVMKKSKSSAMKAFASCEGQALIHWYSLDNVWHHSEVQKPV